jgi:peptide/nickel transport system permease protein
VAEAILGRSATPETLEALREKLQLDRPAYTRYLDWLSHFVVGDFGESIITGRSVISLVGIRLTNTLRLAGFTAIFAVPFAVLFGILAAMLPNSFFDRSLQNISLAAISFPEFFTGAVLVLIFSIKLAWFPTLARVSASMSLVEMIRALALPILTLTAVIFAHMMRMTRNAVINVFSSDYIEVAVLKGLPRWKVILVHALPNALAPIINVIALNLAYLVVGVIVVEVLFSYPGIGKLLVDAVAKRDLPLVQTCGMIFAMTYVSLNLLADVLSVAVNPRLRHSR